MKIIYAAPGAGKTTELIKLAHETGAYLVVANLARVRTIYQQALDLNLTIKYPITVSEFLRGEFYPLGMKGFIIDDAENIFTALSKSVPILAISLTNREEISSKVLSKVPITGKSNIAAD